MFVKVNSVVKYKADGQKFSKGPGDIDVPKNVGEDLIRRGCAEKSDGVVIDQPAEPTKQQPPKKGTVPWLQQQLTERGIAFTSDHKKQDLEALLKAAEEADSVNDPNGAKGEGEQGGSSPEGGESDSKPEGVDDIQPIVEVIEDLDPDDAEIWGEDGLPLLSVVIAQLGDDVTEAQLSQAWDIVNAAE